VRKSWAIPVILGLGLYGAGCGQAAAQLAPNPNVEFAYIPPKSAKFQAMHDRLKTRQVLEQLAVFLAPLKLPATLRVQIDECGALTRVVTRAGGATICYEYLEAIDKAAVAAAGKDKAKRKQYFAGAFIQSTLYRVALLALDILDAPIWGRYTDAADRLAAAVMLEFNPEYAQAGFSGANVFFKAQKKSWTGADFASINQPAAQRRYNYLCMAYGFDESQYEAFKKPLGTRADDKYCAAEYKQGSLSFFTLLWPHIDEDKADMIRDIQFIKPDDLE
jgi:Putative metallopeptidase